MKNVPDTMIWVSYCVSPDGYRRRLIDFARRRRVRLFVSKYILDELEETLIEDLGQSRRFAKLARRAFESRARLVVLPDFIPRHVPGDVDDDPIVQTALIARADFLVTADREVLKVGKLRSVRIVTADVFAEHLGFVMK